MVEANEINPLGEMNADRYREGAWARTLLERVAWWVKRLHNEGALLDIGCGDGVLLQQLHDLYGVGLDLHPGRLKTAARKGMQVMQADAQHLPFRDGSLQTVVCMEVLEHVPDMEAVMHEVERVLSRGGYWLVSVPSVTLKARRTMARQGSPVYCDAREHYREFTGCDLPWFQHKFMRLDAFEAMFRRHGFHVWRREGLFFELPDTWLPLTIMKKLMETSMAHRLCSRLPFIRHYPYWTILVLRKSIGRQ